MRIAQITPYYPPHMGGVEIHVKNLTKALSERHEVDVVSSNSGDVVVPSIDIPYSPIPVMKVDVRADIYHAHVPSPFFANLFRGKKPLVITYHNDVVIPERVSGFRLPAFGSRIAEFVNEKIVRRILDEADAIIATTHDYALTSPILREYMDRVHVIPNGIWVDDFEYRREKEDFLLYAGRLVEYKGLGTLISALEGSDVRLVVAGDGEDRGRFEKLVEVKRVKAEFLGRVSYDTLKDLMSRAKALILPSKTRLEAFGIVLLEAMASGTPVIACNTPGVRFVARHGGFVFDSVEELRRIIESLDDAVVRRMGRRGRRYAERHDWRMIAREVERVYERIL
ncbi:Glycosyltransferase [Geoglobus ahangari]|uniref:Glycosyltransferase n=1 Tax=Geoglobus ahangari TaxID=113653 RepID=A0A0F7IEA5_9EURY|nr:glycosyltransferase [Geoglobus ahangari]AKG91284.1 Glycosyltransferase [Geoglobus ahangari]